MKIKITGDAKEIAALVLAVQERQGKAVVETTARAGNVVAEAEKSQPTGEGIKCKTFLETLASFGLTTGKLSCYQRPQPL